jgi:hypothetical protein
MARLKRRLPMDQEQLEVRWSEVRGGSGTKPIAKAPQRVRVLPPRRRGPTAPTKVSVKALEKQFSRGLVFPINGHWRAIITSVDCSLRPRPYACSEWRRLRVLPASPKSPSCLVSRSGQPADTRSDTIFLSRSNACRLVPYGTPPRSRRGVPSTVPFAAVDPRNAQNDDPVCSATLLASDKKTGDFG